MYHHYANSAPKRREKPVCEMYTGTYPKIWDYAYWVILSQYEFEILTNSSIINPLVFRSLATVTDIEVLEQSRQVIHCAKFG